MTHIKTDIYRDTMPAEALYVLGLGDDSLVLGQRWSEWLSKAPALELDIASSNLSLDLIGQAQLLLGLAGEREGAGRDADMLAYKRDAMQFRNHLLVEQPNIDWGVTIARQVLFSCYQYLLFERLAESPDERLAEIAAKSLKEIAYHRRFSADWLVRLGQGTEESARRVQKGLDRLWRFSGELFETTSIEEDLAPKGKAVRAEDLKSDWDADIDAILSRAGLRRPESKQMITGRMAGHHTEHLGHMLAEMQFLQRAYPGAKW
ncbi:1,2-phenylacetyl-CoA epoxidase subunit PaaC [Yunchengibacter salinarum]|uniref:1,2-phenylacetyl-CoA epoxidase subunit PaaC n=1 Tax=Yunchengibacter salinarum TaxID=3133399 RepID=UPI0035B66657